MPFLSDEDTLFVENLETALQYLVSQNDQLGVCIFSGEGENMSFHRKDYAPGVDAVIRACCMSYLTGVCLNTHYIRTWDIFAQAEHLQDNTFFLGYTYCIFGVLLARYLKIVDSDIKTWILQQEVSTEHDWGDTKGMPTTWLPERRICESRDAVKFVKNFFNGDDLKAIFINRMVYFYFRYTSDLYVYKDFGRRIKTMYCWSDIWMNQYKNCLQVLSDLEGKIKNISSFIPKIDKEFFYYLVNEKTQKPYTPEENLLLALQAQVAKYYYETGVPIERIDFEACEKCIKDWVKDFLSRQDD